VLRENTGFVSASRGARAAGSDHDPAAPEWVALYGIADEQGARTYLDRARSGHRARYSALPGSFPDALIGRGRAVYRREEVVQDDDASTGTLLIVLHDGTAETAIAPQRLPRASRYRLVQDLSGGGDAAECLELYETDIESAASALNHRGTTVAHVIAYDVITTATEPAHEPGTTTQHDEETQEDS